MNPPLSFAAALTQLKLMTSQTANFTFSDDELTQALTTAWQDAFVVVTRWDSSLTYQVGVWQYTIPPTLTTVKEIYIILPDGTQTTPPPNTQSYPGKISEDLYEIVNGQIQFLPMAQNYLGNSYTLYLKGNYKFTVGDALPTDNLINYVLSNSAYIMLRSLLLKSTFVFLRNDTSVADIIRARQDMQSDMLRYKQALQREFESV